MVWKERKGLMAAAVVAALLAGTIPAEAAGARAPGGEGFWSQLLGWMSARAEGFARLAAPRGEAGAPASLWGAAGSGIDPDGQPHASAEPPATTSADEGSGIDPDGR